MFFLVQENLKKWWSLSEYEIGSMAVAVRTLQQFGVCAQIQFACELLYFQILPWPQQNHTQYI